MTELHYNPSDLAGDTAEFIEIKNVGDATANVSGYTISALTTVSFTQTTVAPGGFLILTSNAAAFQAKYGFAAGGTFTGA